MHVIIAESYIAKEVSKFFFTRVIIRSRTLTLESNLDYCECDR